MIEAIRKWFGGPSNLSAFLSFDVEALQFRAPSDQVSHLIWGKTSRGEYGIRRICGILRQHKIKANFLVEMAACDIYGNSVIREVFDYLLGEGHEVHAHLHPEMLAERWKLAGLGVKARQMGDMDQRLSAVFLRYSMKKYQQMAGRPASFFRCGSYLFNRHTITEAKAAGFSGLTNFNSTRHGNVLPFDPVAFTMEPFRWGGGPVEMPVDISSPEKSKWASFVKACEDAFSKKEEKTFNMVMHSWSLLRRDANGHHIEFGPELEEQVHRICAHLVSLARLVGYEEYISKKERLPVVDSQRCLGLAPIKLTPGKECPGCGAIMPSGLVTDNACPSCSLPGVLDFSPVPAGT